jgi:VPDSG-CTERM motif
MSRAPNSGSKAADLNKIMSYSTMKMKNETPLLTVPSRSSLRLAAVLVIAALMAFCPTLMRAVIIAENTGGTSAIGNISQYGQSFTTVTGTPESNIAFNFFSNQFPPTTPYALGTGFLLSMEYLGTAANLSSATPGFLGQATASGGFYTFDPSLTLLPATQYFFYENAVIPASAITGGNVIAGGHLYFTNGDNNPFGVSSVSLNFRVTGSPAGVGVPDGGSTVSLLSLASLGLVALRRKLRC